jgi:hypothetical protein
MFKASPRFVGWDQNKKQEFNPMTFNPIFLPNYSTNDNQAKLWAPLFRTRPAPCHAAR